MSYHQDWLMRQIEAITAMLAYILSGRRVSPVTVEAQDETHSGENELYLRLQALVRQEKICEAENLLYEAMEEPSRQVLDAATRFYADLNQFSDETPEKCNFSRAEIMDGLADVCKTFCIPI